MRNPESQKLYLDRQKAQFKKTAEGSVDFHVGDILIQTGGTEHHPKWWTANPRTYVGARLMPGNILYLGVGWHLFDAHAKSWGWAHEFFHLDLKQVYVIKEYPTYLRGSTFTKVVGVE